MKPDRRVLNLLLDGAGLEAPVQQRLSRREMQQTIAERCLLVNGSSYVRGTISLQAVIGIKADN